MGEQIVVVVAVAVVVERGEWVGSVRNERYVPAPSLADVNAAVAASCFAACDTDDRTLPRLGIAGTALVQLVRKVPVYTLDRRRTACLVEPGTVPETACLAPGRRDSSSAFELG